MVKYEWWSMNGEAWTMKSDLLSLNWEYEVWKMNFRCFPYIKYKFFYQKFGHFGRIYF